jgi:hypothetical protein
MQDPAHSGRRGHTRPDHHAADEDLDGAGGMPPPDLDETEEVSPELAEALGEDRPPADRSRPMDFHIRAEGHHLRAKLDALAARLAALRPRERFSPTRANQLERCVAVLALNLYAAWKADPEATVRLPRRSGWYAQPRRGRRRDLPRGISHAYFVAGAFGGFAELGLAEEAKKGLWTRSGSEARSAGSGRRRRSSTCWRPAPGRPGPGRSSPATPPTGSS